MKIRKITEIKWIPKNKKKPLCFLWIGVNVYLLGIYARTEGGNTASLEFSFKEGNSEGIGKKLNSKLWEICCNTDFPTGIKLINVLFKDGEGKVKVNFLLSKKGFCETAVELACHLVTLLGPFDANWFSLGKIYQRTLVEVDGDWISYEESLFQKYTPISLGTKPA